MSVLDRKWVRIVFAAVIAAGLVAVTCVDVAVAQQRREHDRKVAAARAEYRVELAFLAKLAPVANDVYRAAAPVQSVLAALANPGPDDVFAARDALAHGGSLAALRKLSNQLHALRPPAGLQQQTASLVKAVDAMKDALTGLAAHGKQNGFDVLANALGGDDATGFGIAQSNFIDAVVASYGRDHAHPPFTSDRDGPRLRSTSTSWIFGADRACDSAYVGLLPVIKLEKQTSLSSFRQLLTLWSQQLSRLSTAFTHLPEPRDAHRLPLTVRSRLGAIKSNAAVFDRALRAVNRQDADAFDLADRQLHEVLPLLAQLGKALSSYGAVHCGLIMGIWAGDKSASKSGGGVTAT
ncbi:MAG: hypothetical protein QOC82_2700 [Frankiaceae bacterium]|jgi:hypothetical protein|nr:hypothetical protein [Frankiaceae bacterium]